jgi:hypothetical protein
MKFVRKAVTVQYRGQPSPRRAPDVAKKKLLRQRIEAIAIKSFVCYRTVRPSLPDYNCSVEIVMSECHG